MRLEKKWFWSGDELFQEFPVGVEGTADDADDSDGKELGRFLVCVIRASEVAPVPLVKSPRCKRLEIEFQIEAAYFRRVK